MDTLPTTPNRLKDPCPHESVKISFQDSHSIHVQPTARSTQDVVSSVSYQCRQLDFPFNLFSNMINHDKVGLNHDFLLHGHFSPIRCKKLWTISHNFFWKNPKWTIFQCRFRQNSDAGTWVNQPPVILSSSLQRWQQWHTNEPIEPRHIPFRNIFRSNQPKRTILENNTWCPTDIPLSPYHDTPMTHHDMKNQHPDPMNFHESFQTYSPT